jgi:hypothetical protein
VAIGIPQPDSFYVFIGSGWDVNFLPPQGKIISLKFKEDGTNTEANYYGGIIDTIGILPFGATSDSSSNIYFTGRDLDVGVDFIAKASPAGNLLYVRSWSRQSLVAAGMDLNYNSLIFYNDSIYLQCKINQYPAIVKLDTMLNGFCNGPDSMITLTRAYYPGAATANGQFYPPSNYTMTSVNSIGASGTFPGWVNDCFIATVDLPYFTDFIPYPNPVSEELTVSVSKETSFQIIDMFGRSVLSGTTFGKIDVSLLHSGMYFLVIGPKRFSVVIE